MTDPTTHYWRLTRPHYTGTWHVTRRGRTLCGRRQPAGQPVKHYGVETADHVPTNAAICRQCRRREVLRRLAVREGRK